MTAQPSSSSEQQAQEPPRTIEWAVVSRGFRGVITVHKGELASREEAEAWRGALTLTQRRRDSDHFYRTDGIVVRDAMQVAWREVLAWRTDDPSEDDR